MLELFEELIEGRSYDRVMRNEQKIRKATEPPKVAEYVAADETVKQSKAKVDEKYNDLTPGDRRIADTCAFCRSGLGIYANKTWGG